jgi:exosortase
MAGVLLRPTPKQPRIVHHGKDAMTVTRLNARSLTWPVLLTFAIPVGCLIWAFGNTLAEMAHAWRTNPQSSHGFIVPIFALYLLWHRRHLLAADSPRPSWLGLPLLAAGIALHLYGAFFYYIWLDAVAFVPTLAGLWLTCGGKAGWRWGWPSILFLIFMVPLPYRAAIAMSGPLQRLATVVATFIMQCCGMPALAEGNVILLNENAIDVVEACSGLRMLVVFFALATGVVLVSQRPLLDRIILILSAIPIALISNITRIFVTGVLFDVFSNSQAVQANVHDWADWLMMPFALGLLWVELKLLDHLFIKLPPVPPRSTRAAATRRSQQAQPIRMPVGAAAARPARPRPLSTRKNKNQPAPQPQTSPAEVAVKQPTVEAGEAKD